MNLEFLDSLKKDFLNIDKELYEDLEEYSPCEEENNNAIINFYAKVGFLRDEKKETIINLFMAAYKENSEKAIKLLFYTRDKDAGLGERRIFRIIINELGKENSEILKRNIELIPIYGRWDDLYSLFDTNLQGDAIRFIRKQIGIDLKSEVPSTLSKWLKSENTSSLESKILAKKTRQALDLTSKEYRVLLSHLRKRVNIVETSMRNGQWDKIKYGDVPYGAIHKYYKSFYKHDPKRYTEYCKLVNKKESLKILKDDDSNKQPYGIIKNIILNNTKEECEKYWKENFLEDKSKNNTIVCIGLSEKTINTANKGAAYFASISSALYFLNKNHGIFKNYILTANKKPNFAKIKGDNILTKIKKIELASLCNKINIEEVLDVLLYAGIKNNLKDKDMPDQILFIIDENCKTTYSLNKIKDNNEHLLSHNEYRKIKHKWKEGGFKLPNLCIWKIEKESEASRIIVDSNNIKYAYDYSNNIFNTIVNCEDINSNVLVNNVLNNPRYSLIK